jgi:ATP-dependent Clp protease ATP-binding subunit ClpA
LSVVGTRHLLSGLLASGHARVIRVLHATGIDPEELERALAGTPVAEPELPGVDRQEQLSVPASDAVALAVAEAQASGGDHISPEHLLLGLIAEPDGNAGKVLRAQGAELVAARAIAGSARSSGAGTRSGSQQAASLSAGSAVESVLSRALSELAGVLAAAIQEQIEPVIDRVDRLVGVIGIPADLPVPGRPARPADLDVDATAKGNGIGPR